ncbi:MAG: O-antigen ligase family protein [bacterium]
MSSPDGASFRRRHVVVLGLWLLVGCLLFWLTQACLFGEVVLVLTPDQIRGGKIARLNRLPAPTVPWPAEFSLDVFEDGRPLGPRVKNLDTVRKLGNGAYAVVLEQEPTTPAGRTLYFSASDGSSPHVNGRQYVVRFPRRQLPAATALLVLAWMLLPWGLIRWRRTSSRPAPLPSTSALSLIVAAAVYSLFVVQAWLPPANSSWLLALVAVGLAPALCRLLHGEWVFPRWLLWLSALLVWAICSSFGGSSYADPASAAGFLAVSAGGLVLYVGFRQALADPESRGTYIMTGLFVLVAGLSLARDAGLDPAGALAFLRLVPQSSTQLDNLWTTKFIAHWLLVIGWSAVAALGWSRGRRRASAVLVTTLGAVAIGLNGSKAALFALIVSVAVATSSARWSTAVRRVLVLGLILGLLLTPLIAALPWSGQAESLSSAQQEAAGSSELAVRGGIWEFSRRLVSLRPIEGWGLGASANLPGRGLPIADALGLQEDEAGPKLSRHPALAGGHPHNAALLTWLDLGLVGALLVAGLLVAVGKSIAVVQENRFTHAGLLGLLSATAAFLIFNYPVWEPEVASILWMTVVLAATMLPTSPMPRRALFRDGTVILVILMVGGAVLLYDRASRWLTVWEVRGGDPVLDRAAGEVLLGNEVRALDYGNYLDAGAELVQAGPAADPLMRGWAYVPSKSEPPDAVLVFVGSELAGIVWPERPSPEAFAQTEPKDVRALVSGFLVPVEPEEVDLEAPVTVVALGSKRSFAVELPPLAADPPSNGGSAGQESRSSEGVRRDPLSEVECSVSQDELVLTNLTVTSSVTEKACKTITAGPLYMIGKSGSVDFEAPRIVLRDGFAVEGSFSAISAVP